MASKTIRINHVEAVESYLLKLRSYKTALEPCYEVAYFRSKVLEHIFMCEV